MVKKLFCVLACFLLLINMPIFAAPVPDVTADIGQTLIAIPTATDADGDDITFLYQWQVWQADTETWGNIEGAITASYTPPTVGFYNVVVIPNDGKVDGDAASAIAEIIQPNRPPVIENLIIQVQ